MSTGASLDFPKAQKIATLEVPVTVLELPQGRLRMPSMKDVSFYRQSIMLDRLVKYGFEVARDEPL